MWRSARVVGEDMETSYLFAFALLRGMKAGAILTVDCNVFVEKELEYDPYGTNMDIGVRTMCEVALAAVLRVSLEDTSSIQFPSPSN